MDETGTHTPPTAVAGVPVTTAPLSRRDRMRGPLVTAGLVGGLTLALHVRDPHAAGSWGFCPWTALTGFYCPGCGGLRAVNDLTNGDLVGAASSNLVFVALVPVLVFWWLRWAGRSWAGAPENAPDSAPDSAPVGAPVGEPGKAQGVQHPGVWIAVFAVVMVVFAVVRNLPAGSWLAP